MKTKIIMGLIGLGSLLTFFISCDKDSNNGSAKLNVRLTDAPAAYDQVLVDIRSLEVNVTTEASENVWISLPIRAGIYNLLDFRNGLDTLIARGNVPAGTISQMRLVLGTQNSVVIDGQTYSIATPSSQQSGLKFNVQTTLEAGLEYHLWIDFDAARSIVTMGNGGYSLKPVIRCFSEASSGAISGTVSPALAMPTVLAINGTDTLSTIAGLDGKFMIKGVAANTYKVVFEPQLPYSMQTVEGVIVVNGQVTNMGTISF